METNDSNWLDPRTWGPPVLGLIVAASSYLRKKRATIQKTDTPIPQNGGSVVEGFREIGGQHQLLLTAYRDRADKAESRAERLEREKEEMADELMKQATEIAKLRADVSILEAQVAGLLKQVEKLERKS